MRKMLLLAACFSLVSTAAFATCYPDTCYKGSVSNVSPDKKFYQERARRCFPECFGAFVVLREKVYHVSHDPRNAIGPNPIDIGQARNLITQGGELLYPTHPKWTETAHDYLLYGKLK